MSYALQIPGNIFYHTDDIMDRFTINITTIIEADITQVGFQRVDMASLTKLGVRKLGAQKICKGDANDLAIVFVSTTKVN